MSFSAAEVCRSTTAGRYYSGYISWTRTGIPCQRWDVSSPHEPNYDHIRASLMPDAAFTAANNFCRNPDPTDSTSGPWCYTSDPERRWMQCAVPWCQGNGPVTRDLRNSLQWRHNEYEDVLSRHRLDCLLNRLSRRRSKKTSKLRVTGLCEGNSPVTGEFPAQRASNADNVSIWWRHNDSNSTATDKFNNIILFQSFEANDNLVAVSGHTKIWLLCCCCIFAMLFVRMYRESTANLSRD